MYKARHPAIKIRCPKCHAGAHTACRSIVPGTRIKFLKTPHADRIYAWKEKESDHD